MKLPVVPFLLGALLLAPPLSSSAVAATATAQELADAKPSHEVRVSGAVKNARAFDLAALQQLTADNSGPMDVICASGAVVGTVNNFRGARLTDVLDAAGLDFEGHKDDRRMVVVARATDGYTVTFSWNELYNTMVGEEVLIAWEKDGKPLEPHEGQLLLISGKDIKTGPRHVRNLNALEVVRMQ